MKNMYVVLLISCFYLPQISCEDPSRSFRAIKSGFTEVINDSPWHVAIFNRDKILICGGTIIHPKIVLSAAHCFYDEATNKTHSVADYEIIVSKLTRNYSTVDNENQKNYKIKEIRLSKKGYMGSRNNFAADIATLVLERNITFNPTVSRAEIDWESLIEGVYPAEGSFGKVAGWGLDESGKYTERLMAVNLSFVSRARCLSTVPVDFRGYITFDKFCAGSAEQDGPNVLQGDSGGGLLFQKEDNEFYLRGVVSLKQTSLTAIAAFTDLTDHFRWIFSVINEVEKRSTNEKSTVCSFRKKLSSK